MSPTASPQIEIRGRNQPAKHPDRLSAIYAASTPTSTYSEQDEPQKLIISDPISDIRVGRLLPRPTRTLPQNRPYLQANCPMQQPAALSLQHAEFLFSDDPSASTSHQQPREPLPNHYVLRCRPPPNHLLRPYQHHHPTFVYLNNSPGGREPASVGPAVVAA